MGTELLEKEDASMNARNVNSVSCVNATSMSGKASAVFFASVRLVLAGAFLRRWSLFEARFPCGEGRPWETEKAGLEAVQSLLRAVV